MFPELDEIQFLADTVSPRARVSVIARAKHQGDEFPIHGFSWGSEEPNVPVLGIVGGVHGLEKIGTHVAVAFLKYVEERMRWDELLYEKLRRMRIFFVPLVNPVGMKHFSRCNGSGVDLMRNAPIVSKDASWLVGGHHLSSHLPWYRGNREQTFQGMEVESQALIQYVREQIEGSPCSIALDLHSGFGLKDQIWFPYAHTRQEFPHLAEVVSLKRLMDQVLPHHVYRFESQARHYRTHGDLWDYLYQERMLSGDSPSGLFLPLTLEMGSWSWIKKNPLQLTSFLGVFNPVKPHRQKRALRRHVPLFDFLCRALISFSYWSELGPEEKNRNQVLARGLDFCL